MDICRAPAGALQISNGEYMDTRHKIISPDQQEFIEEMSGCALECSEYSNIATATLVNNNNEVIAIYTKVLDSDTWNQVFGKSNGIMEFI